MTVTVGPMTSDVIRLVTVAVVNVNVTVVCVIGGSPPIFGVITLVVVTVFVTVLVDAETVEVIAGAVTVEVMVG